MHACRIVPFCSNKGEPSGSMTYTLEVVRLIENSNATHLVQCKFEHMGYMSVTFKTKKLAAEYYDLHNKHMRKLNALGNWTSDYDPKTHLAYIVRDDYNIYSSITPFDREQMNEWCII